MTDSEKLRTLIKNSGLKYQHIAEKLEISAYCLQMKIENKTDFKSGEIAKLCSVLNITSLKQKEEIFFADFVD